MHNSLSLRSFSLSLSVSVINFFTSSFLEWLSWIPEQDMLYSQFHGSSNSSSSSGRSSREDDTLQPRWVLGMWSVKAGSLNPLRRRNWRDLWVGAHIGHLSMSSARRTNARLWCWALCLCVCVCMCVYVCMLRCRMKIKRYTDLYVCLVSVSFISPTSSLVQVTLLLRVGVVITVMCFSNNTPLTADVLQTHSDVSPCSEYM